jgi:hypothetical protein
MSRGRISCGIRTWKRKEMKPVIAPGMKLQNHNEAFLPVPELEAEEPEPVIAPRISCRITTCGWRHSVVAHHQRLRSWFWCRAPIGGVDIVARLGVNSCHA